MKLGGLRRVSEKQKWIKKEPGYGKSKRDFERLDKYGGMWE